MKEFTVSIEIDEDGSITAETKGITGDICVTELEEVLKDIEGDKGHKNKPEFYSKKDINSNKLNISK